VIFRSFQKQTKKSSILSFFVVRTKSPVSLLKNFTHWFNLHQRNPIDWTNSEIKIFKRTCLRIENIQRMLLPPIPKWNYFNSMEIKITRNHQNM